MRTKTKLRKIGAAAGGYRMIAVPELAAVWCAYRTNHIRLLDLRVWLACQEMLARRSQIKAGRTARYHLDEIARLLGRAGTRGLRGAVDRLTTAGLINWTPDSLTVFAPRENELPFGAELRQTLAGITNNRRLVPIPRRMIRCLCRSGTRALIATVLGHALRCLYRREGAVNCLGSCKASWIASTFGVHLRTIKAARRRLCRSGWLQFRAAAQWRMNRYGGVFEVNLNWGRGKIRRPHPAGSVPRAPILPPPEQPKCTVSPPPKSNRKLPSELKNQNPSGRGPAGAYGSMESKSLPRPSLERIAIHDLRDPQRLRMLYEQATHRGIVSRSEAGRLSFHAAAQHALGVGRVNPCGLFATIVRKGLWAFITQADEEHARRMLKYETADNTADVTARRSLRAHAFHQPRKPEDNRMARVSSIFDGGNALSKLVRLSPAETSAA